MRTIDEMRENVDKLLTTSSCNVVQKFSEDVCLFFFIFLIGGDKRKKELPQWQLLSFSEECEQLTDT